MKIELNEAEIIELLKKLYPAIVPAGMSVEDVHFSTYPSAHITISLVKTPPGEREAELLPGELAAKRLVEELKNRKEEVKDPIPF